MARKLRLLTDSTVKKEKALEIIKQKEELMEERKQHRKKQRLHADSTKVEVIKTYLALGGNLQLTAGSTGIPYETLKNWKATDWWKNLVAEFKKIERLDLSQRTKIVIEKSLELLHDRLDNGDVVFNSRTGEYDRKPVNAKDLHYIARDMMDRKLILDKAFDETVVEVTKDDRLASLAARFAALAEKALDKPKPTVEVTDVVFVTEEKSNA